MPAAPLVTLDHVDVDLAGVSVLRDVTWQLMRGEHWGIVGANGSGKSTLLGLIAGTIWPAPERGTRRYDFGAGEETDAVRAAARSCSSGTSCRIATRAWRGISRRSTSCCPASIAPTCRAAGPRPASANERSPCSQRLGVGELAPRRFLELSRGEQRRVLIARGVAFEPTVLAARRARERARCGGSPRARRDARARRARVHARLRGARARRPARSDRALSRARLAAAPSPPSAAHAGASARPARETRRMPALHRAGPMPAQQRRHLDRARRAPTSGSRAGACCTTSLGGSCPASTGS